MTEPLAVPVWAWVAVMTAIVVMLAIDLFMHRDNHVIEFREAAVWSILWIGAVASAVAFLTATRWPEQRFVAISVANVFIMAPLLWRWRPRRDATR